VPDPAHAPRLALRIGPSYPEPFARDAFIPYELAAPARVSARIVDPAGRIVVRLGGGEMAAGRHLLRWDGQNAAGRAVAPGAYRLVIESGNHRASESLLRVRP
jgi:flagellar hook assembly protein FlgD